MTDKEKTRDIRTLINQFRISDHWAVSLARDLIWVVAVVGCIAIALFLICGTWPAVVTIESESMVPNMNVGDLVVVVQKDRFGDLQTWDDGKVSGYKKFGDYGDVIIYRPNGLTDMWEFMADDIEQITGIKVNLPVNKKGAEILFVTPSGDYFADPGTYTCMGYMMLFHEIGLDYTWSTYASEGGNFGLFTSHEMIKRLNAKIYAEAKRLKVKWILGGECGHMWRVMHQYMETMNGPADFLEEPVSPLTGTKFENSRSTKMVHITEFTSDLIKNNKLKLDPSRNDRFRVTYHDSCNPARAAGLLDEPRYVIKNVCNNFFEMPENTIREQTFCCGGGAGLGNDENMEMRMRGGFPRANAVRHVRDKHDVNRLLCMCAIDRATLSAMMEYWAPDVDVGGIHELLANALIMDGEEERTVDLRGEPLKEDAEVDEDV